MQDWLTRSYWVDGVLDSLHFICALGALVLGPIVLARPKGDKSHRWLGRIWSLMMAIIIISALSMYDMNVRPNLFHLFAVVGLVTLSCGLWAIWKYKRTRKASYLNTHQHCMVWAYFGLFMAGLWQIVFNLVRSDILDVGIGMLYNGLGALTALASVVTYVVLAKKYPAKTAKSSSQ